jgi:hypothetical protein
VDEAKPVLSPSEGGGAHSVAFVIPGESSNEKEISNDRRLVELVE